MEKPIILTSDIETTKKALYAAQKMCRQMIKDQRSKKTCIEKEQEDTFVTMNSEMGKKRAAQIFQRAKDTREMKRSQQRSRQLRSCRTTKFDVSKRMIPE